MQKSSFSSPHTQLASFILGFATISDTRADLGFLCSIAKNISVTGDILDILDVVEKSLET